MDLIIRNVEPAVAEKLSEMARKRRLSREHFLRQCLSSFAVQDELIETEDRYSALVKEIAYNLSDTLNRNSDVMEQNMLLMEECRDLLTKLKERD